MKNIKSLSLGEWLLVPPLWPRQYRLQFFLLLSRSLPPSLLSWQLSWSHRWFFFHTLFVSFTRFSFTQWETSFQLALLMAIYYIYWAYYRCPLCCFSLSCCHRVHGVGYEWRGSSLLKTGSVSVMTMCSMFSMLPGSTWNQTWEARIWSSGPVVGNRKADSSSQKLMGSQLALLHIKPRCVPYTRQKGS